MASQAFQQLIPLVRLVLRYGFVVTFLILNGEKFISNMNFLFVSESDGDFEEVEI